MYTVLGANGNIGSVITKKLLEKGEKVRVVGRNSARLQPFVQKGAEPFIGDVADAEAMTRALSGARAAFLMIPPDMKSQDYHAEQERFSDAIAVAVRNAGLHYAVHLSSIGGQAPSGTGPIAGLHASEEKMNAVDRLNVLHLRPAYFFENHLAAIGMIQMMGLYGGAINGALRFPMIATRDIGVYAADRLLKLDFNGKQTQELLGERDLSMNEAATIIGNALNKPELRYAQFPYEQVQQVLTQMGTPQKTAALFIEMFEGFNNGTVAGTEARSEKNTTPTRLETFAKEVFVPAYQGRAVGA
ncbi:MAG TPA: NAD(P)H-binding protein [Candidatus Limnocylindrales bacterium]|nr:NAD(P)H-binding protein [Candidatus Limnocylindrales bacterium]